MANAQHDIFTKKYYYDKFMEMKKKNNKATLTEIEIENYFNQIREEAEFNKWSLLITQKWLNKFYHSKFWSRVGLEMINYQFALSTDNVVLEVCEGHYEGFYFAKSDKIVLCSNLLTNYEKNNLFDSALKRLVSFLY